MFLLWYFAANGKFYPLAKSLAAYGLIGNAIGLM